MNVKKLFPILRKIVLTTIAYWGYILICNAGFLMLITINVSFDPLASGMPHSITVWQAVISYIAFIPLFYDFLVCDRVSQNKYVKSIQEVERFSYKGEIIKLAHNNDFLIGSAVIVFWSVLTPRMFSFFLDCFGVPEGLPSIVNRLIVLLVFTVPAVLMYAVAAIITRRRWFSSKGCYDPNEEVKGIYAFRLIKNALIWAIDFFLVDYLIFILRFSFEPIKRGFSAYIFPTLLAVSALAAFIYVYRRARALIKQYVFIKKLKRFCQENKLGLKLPRTPYASVLKQEIQSFTVSHSLMTFNCLLVPSIIRKIPLYFAGNNEMIRAHTFYFFKIALFTNTTTVNYSFPKLMGDIKQKNILVLSPIPRNIFTGPVGNSAPADNGSEIEGAVIYSGSAFCNYILRLLDNERYKREKKNHINR
ncbi:MAG: hypothetical protein IJO64_06035 [Clostridia bacterium]|nr:hypothetical protein [Clostridia bacterium]